MHASDSPPDRRDFLGLAGGAALALAGRPAAAAGPVGAKIANIGVMSPGDMGQAVAAQLKAEGFAVFTALQGRSERTRALAREAGLIDLDTLALLFARCDTVLSIMDPGAAAGFARLAAAAIRADRRTTLVVDCNAIAPTTAREIGGLIEGAGGRFLDAGIIGPPPRNGAKTNLYVSGPGAADLLQIAGPQILVHPIGEGGTDASALKMCYGAITKGTQALWLEVLVAAERLGIAGVLAEQFQASQGVAYRAALAQLPSLPPRAYRWVPEMEEIAKTLGSAGMTPKMHEGAADTYRLVAASPLGKESPESRDRARQGMDVVRALAKGPG
jgi:3-hydroxyisobutyrate dehydrogenase-like beta-hydroxyacid dehydrogenase